MLFVKRKFNKTELSRNFELTKKFQYLINENRVDIIITRQVSTCKTEQFNGKQYCQKQVHFCGK